MSATLTQRDRATLRSIEVRAAKREVLAQLRRGELTPTQAIADPRAGIAMAHQLARAALPSPPGTAESERQTRKVCTAARVPETRRIRDLTERQAGALVAALGGAR